MLEADDGHIVTIASIAGKLATHGHPDYYASKHAAVGLHDATTMDILESGKSGVRTTLVCPYYIHTPMFDTRGAQTRFPFLMPTLTADYVCERIVEAVQLDVDFLVLPNVFYAFVLNLPFLPYKAQHLIGKYLGLVQSQDRFNRQSNKN
ncbi:unnamed protein product [Caenorhabditis angaria]|uniref:Uncharacterized protein n=1 Tax=Caenorhabditis angaria TaxID=860376 RepID=A0A9P1IS93_9PELO|nr:unnamed protein product [Caenorhabditis angaria]